MFGWALVGRPLQAEPFVLSALYALKPKQALDQICALESLGITDVPLSSLKEEEIALNSFYKNLTFVQGRYSIRWPWKCFPPDIKNNYTLALGRLRSLRQKLTPASFKDYDEVIQQQLKLGIIELVPEQEQKASEAFYLPHRAIFTPGKTTPLRVVYDGSARSHKRGKSLNDLMYKGCNLFANLMAISLRFRFSRVVILSDIEKAFLQLLIDQRDRDYVRFLWFSNSSSHIPIVYRFTRVAFGIIASPFLLNATLKHHLLTHPNEFTEQLLEDTFADNITTGSSNSCVAIQLYQATSELFKMCSMNLRSWSTNDQQLRDHIPAQARDVSDKISVLGTQWDQYTDLISICRVSQKSEFNLRTILSVIGSFFDVFGFFTPLIIRAKILFQKAQAETDSWNDIIPEQLHEEWREIRVDLQNSLLQKFPRFIADKNDREDFELHIFVDASAHAYAAVVFVRVIHKEMGNAEVHFLISRARIVKPEAYTVPKLELLAAVLGTRLIKLIRQALPIQFERQILWSDSKCVLSWIVSSKILPKFIQNRIDDIRAVSDLTFWYVPTDLNPADIPSRGSTLAHLQDSSWHQGPAWLLDPTQWPPNEYTFDDSFEPDLPLLYVAAPLYNAPFQIQLEDFSDFMNLLRVTAHSANFLRQLAMRTRSGKFQFVERPIVYAQKLWLKAEQLFHYEDVLKALHTKKHHPLVHKLGLFLDADGIIRCAHRLRNSPIFYDEKFPILLARIGQSHFTKLIVSYFHALVYHQGSSYTLNAIRKEFWIPAGRAAVSSFVYK